VQQLRSRSRRKVALAFGLLAAFGCSTSEGDRLDLVIRSGADASRPQSLLIYVRDDGPPRAVGAGVYLPPPADLADATQKVSLKPETPFIGGVTVYVIGCATMATCATGGAAAPDCRCERPVSFGAGDAEVEGHTRLDIALGAWNAACDTDADGIVDCGRDPQCCAGVPAATRARISDCVERAPAAECAAGRCNPSRAHPFRPNEPSPAEVTADLTQAARNAEFCEDGLDNDCAGGADVACAQLDDDGDGFSPGGEPADCDDGNARVNPSEPENCMNAIDDDCDGVADVCDFDGDGTVDMLDCDPKDPTRYLGAPDPCDDGIDQDCDGGDPLCIPEDLDGDGTPCTGAEPGGLHRCVGPGQDCDDLNAGAHPGAVERCDPPGTVAPVDENCDGIAEICPEDDLDGDGARGRNAGGADCDDQNPLVNPSASERCGDAIDQDCNGADLPCGGTQDADGDGWPAGADCNDRNAEIFPGAPEFCNARDEDCDGVADEGNPLQIAANAPVADERCGSECLGGLPCRCYTAPQACAPDPAAPDRKKVLCIGVEAGRYLEVCNGLDDDCDAQLNNVAGAATKLSQHCYTGAPGTEDVAPCHGSDSFCVAMAGAGADDPANWGPCDGEVVPRDEICNGIDDDCDGTKNEGPDGEPMRMSCYPCQGGTAGLGPCRDGTTVCRNDTWTPCDGHACPEDEVCNGRDDNCDGNIDVSGGRPLTRACYSGPQGTADVGECSRGVATCMGAEFVGCVGESLPGEEDCDNRDDDCDGQTDEDLSRRCGMTDVGVCEFGAQRCQSGDWGRCNGDVDPGMEICNNLDDDCDGHVDDAVTRPCGSDVGACRVGTQVCAAGTWENACRDEIAPVAESCNGDDDDCDGQTDEGLDAMCDTNAPAPCAAGIRHCVGGMMGACELQRIDESETCDGLDNDCDGQIDEGLGLGEACMAGRGACRTAGQQVCNGAGGVTCNAVPAQPSSEVCNGTDDDCNDVVDDGGAALCGATGDECNRQTGCRCRGGMPCVAPARCGDDGCR
jgi:Notch-like protein